MRKPTSESRPHSLTAVELDRLDSHMIGIVGKLTGERVVQVGDGVWRIRDANGPVLIRANFVFSDFRANVSGRGGYALIKHLCGGVSEKALEIASDFLWEHPGYGSLEAGAVAPDYELQNAEAAAMVEEYLQSEIPVTQSDPVMAFFAKRGISADVLAEPTVARSVCAVPYTHGELTALVWKLFAPDGSIASLHIRLIAQDGCQADVKVPRFHMPARADWSDVAELSFGGHDAEQVRTEGPEDALVLYAAGAGYVFAACSINRLSKVDPPPVVTKILIVLDADKPDNKAAQGGAWKAVAEICRYSVNVRMLPFPPAPHKDANALLLASGIDAVRRWIAAATDKPHLTMAQRERLLTAAAHMHNLGFARGRIAKLLGMGVGALDKELKLRRPKDACDAELSPAALMVKLVNERGVVFLGAADKKAHIELPVRQHRQTFRLESADAELQLIDICYSATREAPLPNEVARAAATLQAQARNRGETRPVHQRVANLGDRIIIDIGDNTGRVVEITAEGFRVLDESPIAFVRSENCESLGIPEQCDDPYILCDLLNFQRPAKGEKPDPRMLVFEGWLVGAYRGHGPFFILVVLGPSGSIKTTTTRLARDLVDPTAEDLVAGMPNKEAWGVQAYHSYAIGLDNLNAITTEAVQLLCVTATGGTANKRGLYTNFGKASVRLNNPIALNSTFDIVRQGDLAQRSLFLGVDRITSDKRKPDDVVAAAVARTKPKVFGLICSLLSNGLKHIGAVRENMTPLPRMAGPFQWATACLDATYGEGAFNKAYEEASDALAQEVLNASPLVMAFITEVEASPEWKELKPVTATYGQWYERLSARAGREATTKEWPRTTRSMMLILREASEFLEKFGYFLEFGKHDIKDRTLSVHASLSSIKSWRVQKNPTTSATSGETHRDNKGLDEKNTEITTDGAQTETQNKAAETPKTQTEESASVIPAVPKGGFARRRAVK